MALQLLKNRSDGTSGNYWKIEEFRLAGNRALILISLYKDQASRAAGKAYMEKNKYLVEKYDEEGELNPAWSFESSDMDALNSNCYSLSYNYLKNLQDFSGSADV